MNCRVASDWVRPWQTSSVAEDIAGLITEDIAGLITEDIAGLITGHQLDLAHFNLIPIVVQPILAQFTSLPSHIRYQSALQCKVLKRPWSRYR
jgi:hypothetical protein